MVDEKNEKTPNMDINEGEFVKSEDKQNVGNSGVGDGVHFANSLPGGGEDNSGETSILTGDEAEGFDNRLEDDPKS